VSKAELILPDELRHLSVFKHIVTTIPVSNRWYPLMLRYLKVLSDRVDALGGNASSVHPNPDGSGKPYVPPRGGAGPHAPPGKPCPPELQACCVEEVKYCGRVCGIEYGCDGHMTGFSITRFWRQRSFRCATGKWVNLLETASRERRVVCVTVRGGVVSGIDVR
jgi:hypothetical protein